MTLVACSQFDWYTESSDESRRRGQRGSIQPPLDHDMLRFRRACLTNAGWLYAAGAAVVWLLNAEEAEEAWFVCEFGIAEAP